MENSLLAGNVEGLFKPLFTQRLDRANRQRLNPDCFVAPVRQIHADQVGRFRGTIPRLPVDQHGVGMRVGTEDRETVVAEIHTDTDRWWGHSCSLCSVSCSTDCGWR